VRGLQEWPVPTRGGDRWSSVPGWPATPKACLRPWRPIRSSPSIPS
jgi:hypothetical protein